MQSRGNIPIVTRRILGHLNIRTTETAYYFSRDLVRISKKIVHSFGKHSFETLKL